MESSFARIDPARDGSTLWQEFPCDWRRPQATATGAYRLYWRAADGFGQILPRPSPQEVAAFYDLDDYYTHSNATPAIRTPGNFLRKVIEHLAWRADKGIDADEPYWQGRLADRKCRILEIGCGHAEKLDWLAKAGHQVLGVEPDERARAAATQRGVPVLNGTAEEMPPEVTGQSFDVILIFHALEHCIDPVAAVRNAAELLAPGGLLIIEVPNNACRGRTFFGPVWYWLDVPRHLNFFTRNSLTKLVAAAGLVPGEVEYTGYCRQFQRPWLDAQTRIARLFNAPARGSLPAQILYLVQTALTIPSAKYDSVRLFATKP